MKNGCTKSPQSPKQALLIVLAIALYCGADGLNTSCAQPMPSDDELFRVPYVEEELICVKVRLFGEEALFAIDTGATRCIIDKSFENRLGKPLDSGRPTETVNGSIRMPIYAAPVIKILNGESELEMKVPTVGVVDFRSIRSGFSQPLVGAIGMDYLKDHVLRLNFDDGYATLVRMPRATPAEIQRINPGNADYTKPSIRMRISTDQFCDIRLDTGSMSNLNLDLDLFPRLKRKGSIVVEGEAVRAGAGGFSNSRLGILDQAEVGEICLRNLDVSTSRLNSAGLKFLERFEAEFDFPNRKAYFRPGKRLHDPPRKNLSHFAVKFDKDKLVVVGSRGMAEAAGIRVGDVLVMINGRPAQEMTISEFRRLQCKTDTELKLRFERNGKPFDAALTLTRPPNPFPDKPLDF